MSAEVIAPDAVMPAKAGTRPDGLSRRHSRESGNPVPFARYPKYKDSGVTWLGEIPKHWDVRRARFLFEIRKRIAGALGYDVLSVTQSGIRIKDIESNDGQLSMDYSKYQIVELGDYAMNHMDLLTGYVDISSTKGVTSPDYRVFSLRASAGSNARYLLYVMQMGYQQKIFFAYGQGSSQLGRWRLPTEQFNDLPLPLPSHREQDAIVHFLDRETAKIDALIAEQERLVALLKEKRQALISHAVTKGLDPNAPMKDSGIEWLGQVPAHWEVVRLRRVVMLNPTKAEIKEIDRDVEVSFLPMEAIGDDGSLSLGQTRAISEVETGYTYFRDGDVTVAKITPCFENGKGAVMQNLEHGIGFGTTELIVARPMPDRLTGNYLARIFSSRFFRLRGEATMYGAGGQKRVPDDFVRGFAIGLPPISEQIIISKILDKEDKAFDALVREAEQATVLLKERRAALISAAVTGKIDVRGAAVESPLPSGEAAEGRARSAPARAGEGPESRQ